MKRLIKYILALLLHYSGFNLFVIKKNKAHLCLMFHRLTDFPDYMHMNMPEGYFSRIVEYCNKVSEIVPIDRAMKNKEDKLSFSLTFDDGFSDNLTLLKYKDLPVSLYVATAYIGNDRSHWAMILQDIVLNKEYTELDLNFLSLGFYDLSTDALRTQALNDISYLFKEWHYKKIDETVDKICEKYPHKFSKSYFLNWSEVKQLADHGVVIGAHTHSHLIVANVLQEEFEQDMTLCVDAIIKNIGIKPSLFAYPNGRAQDIPLYGEESLKKLGFDIALSTIEGRNYISDSPFMIKRINVTRNRVESPFGGFSPALFTSSLVKPFGIF